MEQFRNIARSKIAYFLGYLWADGHVHKRANVITIHLRLDDGQEVLPAFNAVGKFGVYLRSHRATPDGPECHTLQMCLTNRALRAFLVEHDYLIKSGASPKKILSHIPEHLRHYWWRGYFDGDGHINLSTGSGLVFTSCYDQDWSFAEELMGKLGITKHGIGRYARRSPQAGGRSTFHIHCTISMKRVLDYIYNGFEHDGFGLRRKWDKFQALKVRMAQSHYSAIREAA